MFRQQDATFHSALLTAQRELGAMELAIPTTSRQEAAARGGEQMAMEIDALRDGRNARSRGRKDWKTPAKKSTATRTTVCHLCSKLGHFAINCPKLKFAGQLLQRAGTPRSLALTYHPQGPPRRPTARAFGETRGTRRSPRKNFGSTVNRMDEMVAELSDLLGEATLAEQEEIFRRQEEEEDSEEEESASVRPHYGVVDAISDGQPAGQSVPIVELASSSAPSVSDSGRASRAPIPPPPTYPAAPEAEATSSSIQPGEWFSWADDVEDELFR